MSLYNNTKTGSDSTSLGSNAQKILLLPGAAIDAQPQSSYEHLCHVMMRVHIDPPIAACMDILYENIFKGHNARSLRLYLGLPDTVDLHEAIQRRSRVGYAMLCLAEETMAEALEQYADGGSMTGTQIIERFIAWSELFEKHSENIAAPKALNLNLATGERLPDLDDDDPF